MPVFLIGRVRRRGSGLSHFSIKDFFNDNNHLLKIHLFSFLLVPTFNRMLQSSWTLLQHLHTNQLLTKLRLECSQPFSLIIEPLMYFLIIHSKVVIFKFLLHFPFPIMSTKLVPDGMFPPCPRFLTVTVSYANVSVLSSVCKKSSQSADNHVV